MRRALAFSLWVVLGACVGTVVDPRGAQPPPDGGNAAADAGHADGGDSGVMPQDAGVDSGTPDAGRDAGFDCTGRIICDDFERATLGSPWQVGPSAGTVAIDTTRAFSGTRSVKVSINPTTPSDTYRQAYFTIRGTPLIPLANDSVYGRFMIYTDRIPDSSVHWTFAHGNGPVAGGLNATYNLGGMGGLMANYYKNSSPSPTDCWQTKPQVFPTGRWVCVGFLFDGANNEIRFWLDGVEVPELHVIGNQKTAATCTVAGVDGKWYAPNPFQEISIGWESYQNDIDGGHDAWIDDVVLDSQPIGCP